MLLYKINYAKQECKDKFGISIFENGILVKTYPKITDNYNDITELVNMCNELGLELCHIENIIEDYLTDFCV